MWYWCSRRIGRVIANSIKFSVQAKNIRIRFSWHCAELIKILHSRIQSSTYTTIMTTSIKTITFPNMKATRDCWKRNFFAYWLGTAFGMISLRLLNYMIKHFYLFSEDLFLELSNPVKPCKRLRVVIWIWAWSLNIRSKIQTTSHNVWIKYRKGIRYSNEIRFSQLD